MMAGDGHQFQIPDLTVRAFVAIPISILCIFANILLIASLLRPTSQLNTKRNHTLCALACADLVCCICELQYDIETLIPEHHWITNKRCFRNIAYGLVAVNTEMILVWSIGIDRAMAISCALSYDASKKVTAVRYLLIAGSFLYGISITIYGALHTTDDMLVPICHYPGAQAPMLGVLTLACVFINLMVVVTHAWAYYLSRKNNADDPFAKRIQESIAIIALVYISSWASFIVLFAVALAMGASLEDQFVLTAWAGILVRISFGSNCVVLGVRSALFRGEYMKTLRWITCKENQNVAVVVNLA